MSDSGRPVDRRTVLRTIAAASSFAAGGGLASAKSSSSNADLPVEVTDSVRRPSRVTRIEEQFGDVEIINSLFSLYGQPLLETLIEHGYLQQPRAVTVDSFLPTDEYASSDAGNVATASPGRRGETDVIDIRIRQQTDDFEIEYHLNPDIDDAYATVLDPEDKNDVVVYSDGTVNALATSGCCPSTDCDQDCLGCNTTECTYDSCGCDPNAIYYYSDRYCCDQDEETCECLCSWERDECNCTDSSMGCM